MSAVELANFMLVGSSSPSNFTGYGSDSYEANSMSRLRFFMLELYRDHAEHLPSWLSHSILR